MVNTRPKPSPVTSPLLALILGPIVAFLVVACLTYAYCKRRREKEVEAPAVEKAEKDERDQLFVLVVEKVEKDERDQSFVLMTEAAPPDRQTT
ncbi:hypothetical protein T484DRAFT_1817484 [Baffinella frigidus]|nr:hypothetical protein T484DRAFT_1817484 [Cryptophyta sp. CCMP2293]